MTEDKLQKTGPVQVLLERFRQDRRYMHGWHANLVMATYDALNTDEGTLDHDQRMKVGDEAARRFLGALFAGEKNVPLMFSDEEARTGPR